MSGRRPTISRSRTEGAARTPRFELPDPHQRLRDEDGNRGAMDSESDSSDGGEGFYRGQRDSTRIQRLFNTARHNWHLALPSPNDVGIATPRLRTPRTPRRLQSMPMNDGVPMDELQDLDDPVSYRHHRRQKSGQSSYFGYNSLTPQGPRSPMEREEDRSFYDDFTTIDWIKDTVNESARRKYFKSLRGVRGRVVRMVDAVQGWVLIGISGFAFAGLAYIIDFFEELLTDLRHGYCTANWLSREAICCPESIGYGTCDNWRSWAQILDDTGMEDSVPLNFLMYGLLTVLFAFISVRITLRTKSVNPLRPEPSEDDEDSALLGGKKKNSHVIYTAYGSGVPEVKTILSGFVIRGFLGTFTLTYKTVALIFSVASGLCLGKEGPYVHLATCVGNITCRLSNKFSENDMKRRQLLSAAASAGVALAFGSPLGGVLFALEEISYYFLPQQLFRMFFCAMISTLFLKFMDPYGTGKTVLFEVEYPKDDWNSLELILFLFIGVAGGLFGAAFCKFFLFWGKTFRQWKPIKKWPTLEVMMVAMVTAVLTFPNKYTAQSVTELISHLASPCQNPEGGEDFCPPTKEHYPKVLANMTYALVVKIILTAVTFGLKVPAGIYIPSMAIGALFGRITALTVQYIDQFHPMWPVSFGVYMVPGVYAMAGAGAFMAGVTRLSVTLAVILFELTGSLEYVLPFSLSILVANWVAKAIEPGSIYDLIIHKNNFPFLDNRSIGAYDSTLGDLVTVVGREDKIDIGASQHVSFSELRRVLSLLQDRGEFDGCIPLVDGSLLVGILAAPELEFALDRIAEQCDLHKFTDPVTCNLSCKEDVSKYHQYPVQPPAAPPRTAAAQSPPGDPESETTTNTHVSVSTSEDSDGAFQGVTDLTSYIDPAPLTMDVQTPLALVQQVFAKLGTRVICVTRSGKFIGYLHRKKYIDFTHKS